MKTLFLQDLLDIAEGCAVLAGGGGGELSEAHRYIDEIVKITDSIPLHSLEDIDDETLICLPCRLGNLTDPLEHLEKATTNRNPEENILKAFRVMERRLGQNIPGMVPIEIGCANVFLAVYAAALTDGAFLVDADGCGRSVPDLSLVGPWRLGSNPLDSPIAVATGAGETFLIEGVKDAERADEVIRNLSILSSNTLYLMDRVLTKEKMGPCLAHGTLSMALETGRNLRQAREQVLDVSDVLAERHCGKVVFRGIVVAFELEDKGFTVGHVLIDGRKEFEGHVYRIDFKNESMVGWLDDKVNVTIPEIISTITDDGAVVLNHSHKVGNGISILVLPAPKILLTEEGLNAFGPSYIGLNREFKSALL